MGQAHIPLLKEQHVQWIGCVLRDKEFEDCENPERTYPSHITSSYSTRDVSSTALLSSTAFLPSTLTTCSLLQDAIPPPHGVVKVWKYLYDDIGDKSSPQMSANLNRELVALFCLLGERWCPLTVDRNSRVGSTWLTKGHTLKIANDSSSIVIFSIDSKALNPKRVYIRTACRGAYLLFVNKHMCERAHMCGTAGSWERLEFRQASPSNPYVFNLYNAGVPICFDDCKGCFMLGGSEPAVFSLQSARCMRLLRELAELESQCAELRPKQESQVNVTFQPGPIGLSRIDDRITKVDVDAQGSQVGIEVGWRIRAVDGEKCESFDDKAFRDAKHGNKPYTVTFAKETDCYTCSMSASEEDELVFLQDYLAFAQHQLQVHVSRVGGLDLSMSESDIA